MKVKIATLGAAGALALSGSALAYVERPPIREHVAERRVAKYLRDYPGWRYREGGFIDCRQGRINGYAWACRVAWWSGRRCRHGRVRITNEYAERGVTYYLTSSRLVPCY